MTRSRSAKPTQPVEQPTTPQPVDPAIEAQYFDPGRTRRAAVEITNNGAGDDHLIELIVRGQSFGVIDTTDLRGSAQIELDRMRTIDDLFDWLVKHAGVTEDEIPQIEQDLGDMPAIAIRELMQAMGTAIATAITIPNPSRQPGSSPRTMTPRGRRGRR